MRVFDKMEVEFCEINLKVNIEYELKLQDRLKNVSQFTTTYNKTEQIPLHIIRMKISAFDKDIYIPYDIWIHWGVTTKENKEAWCIPSKFFTSSETKINDDTKA